MKFSKEEFEKLLSEKIQAGIKSFFDTDEGRNKLIAEAGSQREAESVIKTARFYQKLLGFRAQNREDGIVKALTDDIMYTGSDAQGGYINAPAETAKEIARIEAETSVVARFATMRPQNSDTLNVTTDTSDLTVTYTAEAVAKTKTKPTLTQVSMVLRKPALQIILSDEEIQGSLVDIIAYLNQRIGEEFGQDLDYRVLGVSAATPYDSIPHVSGTNAVTLSGHAASDITYAKLVEATVGIKSFAAKGARFYMHRTVLGDVMSIVDGNGRPVFQLDPTQKGIGSILGFPIELVEKMPASSSYAADVVPILFGDLKYWRIGVKHDLRIKTSGDVAVTLDGSLVSCWENNLTAVRAELRRSGALIIPSTFSKIVMA